MLELVFIFVLLLGLLIIVLKLVCRRVLFNGNFLALLLPTNVSQFVKIINLLTNYILRDRELAVPLAIITILKIIKLLDVCSTALK